MVVPRARPSSFPEPVRTNPRRATSSGRGRVGVVLAVAGALILGAAVPAIAAEPVPVPLSRALDMLQNGTASSARVTSGDTGLESSS